MDVKTVYTLRNLLSLSLPLILAGCLQVELRGPVVGAEITVQNLRTQEVVIDGVTTSTEQSTAQTWAEQWGDWPDSLRLAFMGSADIPADDLDDDTLYLVTASGGYDKDWNSDNKIDSAGMPLDRSMHAIMTGAQLKGALIRVNSITDGLYQYLSPRLSGLSDEEVLAALDKHTGRMIGDADRNGQENYQDALTWTRTSQNYAYTGPAIFHTRMARAIQSDLYSEEIRLLDAANFVEGAQLRPYNPEGPWENVLAQCTGAITFGDLCRMEQLPLLGADDQIPTVDQIMDRLLISHDWMAERFEQVLRSLPADIRLLFRSVSAVVLSSEIRPAYYSTGTAAIYLDAQYFWVTREEGLTVSQEADYRAEFGSSLAFTDLWRYVRDGEMTPSLQADANGNLDFEDVRLIAASLLFHELAHAADAIPVASSNTWHNNLTPYQVSTEAVSNDLASTNPLMSPELFGLAGVMYRGDLPSFLERNYSAAQVGQFFESDGASDLYAYSSQYEDVAMLMEEAMMAIHFGIQRDVAFTSVPPNGTLDVSCDDFRVGWGVRGRMRAPSVESRMRRVVKALLPERNYLPKIATLPAAKPLPTGVNWCLSLFLTPQNAPIIPLRANKYPGTQGGERVLTRPH
jgi:hypothetical protein